MHKALFLLGTNWLIVKKERIDAKLGGTFCLLKNTCPCIYVPNSMYVHWTICWSLPHSALDHFLVLTTQCPGPFVGPYPKMHYTICQSLSHSSLDHLSILTPQCTDRHGICHGCMDIVHVKLNLIGVKLCCELTLLVINSIFVVMF